MDQRPVLSQKGLRTQHDNLKEPAKLYEFFNAPPAPLDNIELIHIRSISTGACRICRSTLAREGTGREGKRGASSSESGKGGVLAHLELRVRARHDGQTQSLLQSGCD